MSWPRRRHPLRFVAACDHALGAEGKLLDLFPGVVLEQAAQRHERSSARAGLSPTLRCATPHHDVGEDEDVDPTTRRGLLGVSAGAALIAASPAHARDVDPELPAHWSDLLAVLGHHDDARGPREVLGLARGELRLIAEHREVARGALRTELMRVEARWAVHAGWLCEDAGDRRGRDVLLEYALRLAQEAEHPDVMAWARARQAQWSDAPSAIRLAETGLRTPRASPQARALCATRAAHAYSRVGDSETAERMIAEAEALAARESPPPPLSRNMPLSGHDVRCWAARCWAAVAPAKAIGLYEGVLRDWPRGEARDGGLYRARLAVACADAGEHDRAKVEGRKALASARATKSATTARELGRLREMLYA